jgi:hypothetical protein
MRGLRIAVLTAGLCLLLAASAAARNNVQINYRIAAYITSVWPSGGPNVNIFLGDKFDTGSKQRLVKNDCAPVTSSGMPLPTPDYGYWFFHSHSITVLNCAGHPAVGVKGTSRRNYNYFSRHAIQRACRMMRHERRWSRAAFYPCAYRYWDAFRGSPGRDVLVRYCDGSHSHRRLYTVAYASNNITYTTWCDGSRKP